MSDPYRDSGHREVGEAPRDRGIVGDVIAQFADPNAFYRELVQNAIDADSPDVTVEVRYDDATGRMHASVKDRGSGMSRDIIENQLLVLFRSTKENDPTKIGKFGIGFKSVLAPDPELVVVSTVREGKRLIVHLYRDLSYELFDGGRATQSGTTVEVQIAMKADQRSRFFTATEKALRHWCRHASVPIELVLHVEGEARSVRIDSPLSLEDAVVEVTRTFDDGALTVIAGLQAQPAAYLGFFNHGLTLVETSSYEQFGKVSVKVQDSRLGHTLSREDIRRDGNYDRAITAVRVVLRDHLPRAAAGKLDELAGSEQYVEHGTLLRAVLDAGLELPHWQFPLLVPKAGAKSITLSSGSGRIWAQTSVTPLAEALAAAGLTILRQTSHPDTFGAAVRRASGESLGELTVELTAVTPVALTASDELLVSTLLDLLDDAVRRPADIMLADVIGARGDRICVSMKENSQRVVHRDEATKSPFALIGRRVLVLSAGHPIVAAARTCDDPRVTAAHVARAVLVEYELMNVERSRALLSYALKHLGVGP